MFNSSTKRITFFGGADSSPPSSSPPMSSPSSRPLAITLVDRPNHVPEDESLLIVWKASDIDDVGLAALYSANLLANRRPAWLRLVNQEFPSCGPARAGSCSGRNGPEIESTGPPAPSVRLPAIVVAATWGCRSAPARYLRPARDPLPRAACSIPRSISPITASIVPVLVGHIREQVSQPRVGLTQRVRVDLEVAHWRVQLVGVGGL